MLKTSVVKSILLTSFAFLALLFAGKAAHAQGNIGPGNLTWNVNGVSVVNGGSSNTVTIQETMQQYPVSNPTFGLGVSGINGQGGSVTYACYVEYPGGYTFMPFQGTAYQNTVLNEGPPQYNAGMGAGATYTSWCTATYSGGMYGSGMVTTPILYIKIVAG